MIFQIRPSTIILNLPAWTKIVWNTYKNLVLQQMKGHKLNFMVETARFKTHQMKNSKKFRKTQIYMTVTNIEIQKIMFLQYQHHKAKCLHQKLKNIYLDINKVLKYKEKNKYKKE